MFKITVTSEKQRVQMLSNGLVWTAGMIAEYLQNADADADLRNIAIVLDAINDALKTPKVLAAKKAVDKVSRTPEAVEITVY